MDSNSNANNNKANDLNVNVDTNNSNNMSVSNDEQSSLTLNTSSSSSLTSNTLNKTSELNKTTPTGIVKKNLGFSNNSTLNANDTELSIPSSDSKSNNNNNNNNNNVVGTPSNQAIHYGDDDVANEIRAREELVLFLDKKGLPSERSESYKIMFKRKKIANQQMRVMVYYISPDGEILPKKTDVASHINQQLNVEKKEAKKRENSASIRALAHQVGIESLENMVNEHNRIKEEKGGNHEDETLNVDTPYEISDIQVYSFGNIDDVSKKISTEINIYPIGYKCRMIYTPTLRDDDIEIRPTFVSGSVIECEIIKGSKTPAEFIIRRLKRSHEDREELNEVFTGANEHEVWSNFDPEWSRKYKFPPSFFNFDLELLIEGLPNALNILAYKFHKERGYGTRYITVEEADQMRGSYFSKGGRSKRSTQRSSVITETDKRQVLEARKKEEEAAKALKKKRVADDKLRREKEKEDIKRRKEAERDAKKLSKEMVKTLDRVRQPYRREATNDIKRNRADAHSLVIEKFDIEEEEFEHERSRQLNESNSNHGHSTGPPPAVPFSSGAAASGSVIASTHRNSLTPQRVDDVLDMKLNLMTSPTALQKERLKNTSLEHLCLSSDKDEEDATATATITTTNSSHSTPLDGVTNNDWDLALQVVNFAQTFRDLMDLNHLDLDTFVGSLVALQEAKLAEEKTEAMDSESNADSMNEDDDAGTEAMVEEENEANADVIDEGKEDVEGDTSMNAESIAEAKDSTTDVDTSIVASTSKGTTGAMEVEQTQEKVQIHAEADLDRLQLCATQFVLDDLHWLLDLSDPMEPNQKQPKTTGDCKLPLNSLTWAELTRMCLTSRILQEMDLPRDDVIHGVRGSKHPHFRTSKNLVREVRYKMAYREALLKAGYSLDEANPNSAQVPLDASTITSLNVSQSMVTDATDSSFLLRLKALNLKLPDSHSLTKVIDDNDEEEDTDDNDELNAKLASEAGIEGELIRFIDSTTKNTEITEESSSNSNNFVIPEVYIRCAKILLRLITTNQAKNLIYEVDMDMYPGYYEVIKQPMFLINVVKRVLYMKYGHGSEAAPIGYVHPVLAAFYRDIRLVVMNCLTFNTEITLLVSHAQRLLVILQRLITSWGIGRTEGASASGEVLGPQSLELCDDNHCLLTGTLIEQPKSKGDRSIIAIRCGRCAGNFSIDAMERRALDVQDIHMSDVRNNKALFTGGLGEKQDEKKKDLPTALQKASLAIFEITNELTASSHEEWCCPICLEDAFLRNSLSLTSPSSVCEVAPPLLSFTITDWGPSTTAPWQLNSLYSLHAEKNLDVTNRPDLEVMCQAVEILSKYDTSCIIPRSTKEAEERLPKGKRQGVDNSVLNSYYPSTDKSGMTGANANGNGSSNSGYLRLWTVSERLIVLTALFHLVRSSPKCQDQMSRISNECQRLSKMANNDTFKEADFMRLVRSIAGDHGASVCRALLDGTDTSAVLSKDMETKVMDGRCIVCKGTTYDFEEEGRQILLCDGCNCEVHLACLELKEVPSGEWLCASCKDRKQKRKEMDNRGLRLIDLDDLPASGLRGYRAHDIEIAIQNELIDYKYLKRGRDDTTERYRTFLALVQWVSKTTKVSKFPTSRVVMGPGGSKMVEQLTPEQGVVEYVRQKYFCCEYCGLGEIEVGSPMVFGQSRAEFESHIGMSEDLVANVPDGVYKTKSINVKMKIAGESVLPPILAMPHHPLVTDLNAFIERSKCVACPSPVVHHTCALQMFQARLERGRHNHRRRRRMVADHAVRMSGIDTLPLGLDRRGRLYWKFPSSDDLWICSQTQKDCEQERLDLLEDTVELMKHKVNVAKDKVEAYREAQKVAKAKREMKVTAEPVSGGILLASVDSASSSSTTMEVDATAASAATTFTNPTSVVALSNGNGSTASATHPVTATPATNINGGGDEDSVGAVSDDMEDINAEGDADMEYSDQGLKTLEYEYSDLVNASAEAERRLASSLNTHREEYETRQWIRVADLDNIRAITELLGENSDEVSLRQNINSLFLMGRKPVELSHKRDEVEEEEEEVAGFDMGDDGDAVDAVGSDDGKGDDGDTEDALRKSGRERKAASHLAPGEGTRNQPLNPNRPVALVLKLGSTGVAVQQNISIPWENSFEQDLSLADDEDDATFHQYFTYARGKYYACMFVNSEDKKCKMSKGSAKVTYSVHREGWDQPLAYTPLDEAWSDGIYYFSTLNFRRSGNYTVSFIVEGEGLELVQPLVYPITVRARNIRCGSILAIESLRAVYALHAPHRQILNKRKDLVMCLNDFKSEARSVKSALLSVYAALPLGSLILGSDVNKSDHLSYSCAETNGWNNVMDELFRSYVLSSSNPGALMEACILLEYYINNKWLLQPYGRLISSLSAHHFALRGATYSSVALRIYSLDRALLYDKVEQPKRGKRYDKNGDSSRSSKADERDSIYQSTAPEPSKPRQSRVSKAASEGMSRADVDEKEVTGGGGRKRYVDYGEDDFDSDNELKSTKKRGRKSDFEANEEYVGTKAEPWTCTECTTENVARARSCEVCGAKKPSASISTKKNKSNSKAASSSSGASKARGGGRGRPRKSISYEEVEDDHDGDDDEEEEEVAIIPVEATKKKKRAQDFDSSDDEEDEEDAEEMEVEEVEINLPDLDEYESELSGSDAAVSAGKLHLNILRKLSEDPDSLIFWDPVDTEVFTDYVKVVTTPIDLSIIANRIRGGMYGADTDSFCDDMDKVWENCRKYNGAKSDIGKAATRLEAMVRNMLN